MAKKMPTYSICNLLGADRCMTEIVVTRLRDFVDTHRDIQFPHRHDFYQVVLFTRGGGKHSIDFQQFEVIPHQVYYMAPGQIHSWEFDEETDGYLVNFNESFLLPFAITRILYAISHYSARSGALR
jgi:AraC family transcriptional regulator, transcriptional activator of pobA